MTENKKRFTLAYEKGNWWAVRDGDIILWKEEVIAELNNLHEENVQLKIENQGQSDAIDGLQEMMAHYDLEELE